MTDEMKPYWKLRGRAIAQSPILGTTIRLKRLKKQGYVSLTELQLNPSLRESPST